MIDDRQLSPERSQEEVHLPNRGHGRHGPTDRPTDRSLRPFRFFPLSSSPLPSPPPPPLVLTSQDERQKEIPRNVPRCPSRVSRKKGRNRADRRCSGLCLKTNEHRTARSSSRNKRRDKKAEVDLGPNGSRSPRRNMRECATKGKNDGAQERETEKERGGRQHRVTGAEPIFGTAKCKRNDRPVMHRGVMPAHARVISAGQGIFITWGAGPDSNKCWNEAAAQCLHV
ncbi:hypothetical protein ALC56_00140 [Trachymyrmex septentrionalis]|uniref:Uncharacterized protein n=1 Tax=Trachymyrmex septentrionalis TaxID=34720 RepID=A0A151K1B5_9HYME|nr:hypothetical protein ALC56_00140 [Trachymyrmex septentrionalis]